MRRKMVKVEQQNEGGLLRKAGRYNDRMTRRKSAV
jgi:hypothetical protein